MGKPFQPVERLPVPPEVATSFKKIRSANIGLGHSGGSGNVGKATAKLATAEAEAATHFGGDIAKMRTHFGRWTRWAGRAMGAAEFVMPRETYEKSMSDVQDVVGSKAIKQARVKPIRKSNGGSA